MKSHGIAVVVVVVLFGVVGGRVNAQHQGVDPAYLRQYYQQLQQQQQQSQQSADATPIYEQNSEQTQQYVTPGQQLRVKDTVQEQIRAQHQQQQQQQSYVAPVVREYLQHQSQGPQVQYQPQPQAQQIVYRQQQPQQQAAPSPPRRTQPIHQSQYQSVSKEKAQLQQQRQQQQQEDEEYDDQNSSYQFGFDVKDDEFTNYQNRKEIRDGSVIKGSYSVVDSDGFIRTVKYTADPKEGFKAEVIREPTDIVVKIPTPAPQQLLRNTAGGHGGHKSHDYAAKQQYHQPQQYHQQYQQ